MGPCHCFLQITCNLIKRSQARHMEVEVLSPIISPSACRGHGDKIPSPTNPTLNDILAPESLVFRNSFYIHSDVLLVSFLSCSTRMVSSVGRGQIIKEALLPTVFFFFCSRMLWHVVAFTNHRNCILQPSEPLFNQRASRPVPRF